eukprot:scaffold160854_cov36-Tisochrysis_lutea.AAC.1
MKNYSAVKAANLSLPILLRECAGTPAKLTAAYRECDSRCSYEALSFAGCQLPLCDSLRCKGGKEHSVSVEGLTAEEFSAKLQSLMKGP